jgi:hypothetical protein
MRPDPDLLSIPRFLLVSEGQPIHSVVGRFVAIQGNIARIPEPYHQLPQFRQIRERSPHFGRCFQEK